MAKPFPLIMAVWLETHLNAVNYQIIMKNRLIKLYFLITRKINKGFPTRAEVAFLLNNSNAGYTKSMAVSLVRYKNGKELKDIAASLKIGHEKISQLILRGTQLTWDHLLSSKKSK